MKEYIEREAVLNLLKKINPDDFGYRFDYSAHGSVNECLRGVRYGVKSLPAADVAPVVRCRECKKWDADPDSYGKNDGPKGKCMKSFEETYDNDFCSYGQRKEDDHA